MGGLEVMRYFCYCLWRDCFRMELEDGTEFCMVMVDLMQFLASSVMGQKLGINKKTGYHKKFFDTAHVTRKIDTAVANYINAENDRKRPIVTNTVVFMLDTVHQVPRNKGAKQRTRDGQGGGGDIHMNEEVFREMSAIKGREEMSNLFFIDNEHSPQYPIDGKTVWRSVSLKLQLYRLVTRHVLHAKLKPGQQLLLDDGFSETAENWENLMKKIVEENGLSERSDFEKEFITHQFVTDSPSFILRFLTLGDGQIHWEESTEIGEADIKVQSYIRRGLGLKKFLVVNQDTDVIFILLLHMQTLLEGNESDDEYEVWLDTRPPNENYSIKPWRYINIKKLYYSILAFFKEEFPSILSPIETFCFLVLSKETDFTRDFPSCFQIKNEFIWNVFSELHSKDQESFIAFRERDGTFTKCERRQFTHLLSGLLDSAIQYDHSGKGRFVLKHERISQFYYLLIQVKLMEIRKTIGLTNGNYDSEKRKSQMLPAELLLFGRDVSERLEFFQRLENENKQSMENFFTITRKRKPLEVEEEEGEKKKFKLSSSFGKQQKRRMTISITPDENDEIICSDDEEKEKPERMEVSREEKKEKPIPYHMRNYLVKQRKEILQLLKKDIPNQYCGVLEEDEMAARCYRVEWVLAYMRDGWKGVLPCCEKSRYDQKLSRWGWEERFIEEGQEKRAMNCSYYRAVYDPQSPCLYRFSEVVETSQVHHKR